MMNLIDLINPLTVIIVERSIRNPYWNPYGGLGTEEKIVVFISKIDPNFPSRLLYRKIFPLKFRCNSSVLWSIIPEKFFPREFFPEQFFPGQFFPEQVFPESQKDNAGSRLENKDFSHSYK
jgi:hypothetical protein